MNECKPLVLGIVAASLHLFESCRGRSSIVGSVVTIKVLAAVIATLEFALSGRASPGAYTRSILSSA